MITHILMSGFKKLKNKKQKTKKAQKEKKLVFLKIT